MYSRRTTRRALGLYRQPESRLGIRNINSGGIVLVKNILVIAMFVGLLMLALQARADASPWRVAGQSDASGNSVQVIGGRPAGCPHAYCGCGLMKYLGLTDKRLWKASFWARIFPPTSAQPGAVAVRAHHVMQLVSHETRSLWLVRDYNSGGGLSRIHIRDVRGFKFVSVGVRNDWNVALRSEETTKKSHHRKLQHDGVRGHYAQSNRGRSTVGFSLVESAGIGGS